MDFDKGVHAMGAADSWAKFKENCERDPDFLCRKREFWAERKRVRAKMERWGCYNCHFLGNVTDDGGNPTDGCKAIKMDGEAIGELESCRVPGRRRR
ncbi:hypothetical protein ACFL2Q_03605 [Thermodesulfobacteriota bacterium]